MNIIPKKRRASWSCEKLDILVEEIVIDTTGKSDSSKTLVDQTDSVDSVYHTIFILDNRTEVFQTSPQKKKTPRYNEEEIKKLAFRLDQTQNKKIRFLSQKKFLEKCFHDKLTPNDLKINLGHAIENQNEEFVNQCYKLQDDCTKQLIKITIKFSETTSK